MIVLKELLISCAVWRQVMVIAVLWRQSQGNCTLRAGLDNTERPVSSKIKTKQIKNDPPLKWFPVCLRVYSVQGFVCVPICVGQVCTGACVSM